MAVLNRDRRIFASRARSPRSAVDAFLRQLHTRSFAEGYCFKYVLAVLPGATIVERDPRGKCLRKYLVYLL